MVENEDTKVARRAPTRLRSRVIGAALPPRATWKLRWFARYSRRYLAKHFNAIRLSRGGLLTSLPESPLVIYTNHASWWDPLTCLVLTDELLTHRAAYAPIDADQLERYRIFRGLGFFGVDQHSTRGAAQFLAASEAILSSKSTVLWLTPQGRFQDVRHRPIELRSGIAHLVTRFPRAQFIPLAIEYAFWHDRLPEVFVRFGERETSETLSRGKSTAEITGDLAARLQSTQDLLADEVKSQDPRHFSMLLRGRSGVGGVYDFWRRLAAKLKGEKFQSSHQEEAP